MKNHVFFEFTINLLLLIWTAAWIWPNLFYWHNMGAGGLFLEDLPFLAGNLIKKNKGEKRRQNWTIEEEEKKEEKAQILTEKCERKIEWNLANC
jgi:hypothetical protein